MFAPKVAKPHTKAAESPTSKLAPQRSTLASRPFGGSAAEQTHIPQQSIGDQAMLRLLAQRAFQAEQEIAQENMTAREAPRGPRWDLSKVPVFPPDRDYRPHPSSLLAATPRPGAIQEKLAVGQVDDPLEHEADRVADEVMRMPAPEVSAAAAPPQVSRKCAACEDEEKPQKKSAGPRVVASEAPALVHQALRSPGRPLDDATRAFFEPRFGQDFSRVRVHTDGVAQQSSREVGAQAYAVGHDIVFDAGRHQPGTQGGRRLIAHELTHVVQQTEPPGERVPGMAAAQTRPAQQADTVRRQTVGAGAATVAEKNWVVLSLPPVIRQAPGSLTCWAAALSSWLGARGRPTSFDDIILRYAGRSCIEPDNSLPYATAGEVYAEWGVSFGSFADATTLTGSVVRDLLRVHGHLLFAQTGHAIGHVLVVYGSGFNAAGMPNPDYVSLMDPWTGTYYNKAIRDLDFPIEVGRAGRTLRSAACLSRPGNVPDTDANP